MFVQIQPESDYLKGNKSQLRTAFWGMEIPE